MPSQISELANTVGFKGTPQHRIAEPGDIRTLPVIDNSSPLRKNIRTSVDCYVSGQYVQKNGKITEITQRYTIYVGYSKETQMATMQQVRDRISSDFQSRYGKTFNISTVFIPLLAVPVDDRVTKVGKAMPANLYRGTESFREMTRFERGRFEVGTERVKARLNVQSIRKRYKMR